MKFKYETDRLILRILNSCDVGETLRFYKDNRENFQKFEPKRSDKYYTEDYQRSMLDFEFDCAKRLEGCRYYAFLKEEPNTIMGTVSLRNVRWIPHKSCEIGYRLDYRYTGSGYATEMVECISQVAFKDMGLHRIEAYCMEENEPSIKLLERTGFLREGLIRDYAEINGVYKDHVLYSLLG